MSATLWRAVGRATRATQTTPKTVTTEVGRVDLAVPRDRAGTFAPVTVPKHQRRLEGLSQNVISLYAKGLTTGEIQAHLEEIYDTGVSRETISKITDEIVADMAVWQNRPLDAVYPVLLIDAIVVKVRDAQVANGPVCVAIGVDLSGERDVLGLWLGPTGGEGAKAWVTMLTELRNRGLADALIVCCDGLRGLPDAIRATWPQATVQTCVVHMAPTAFDMRPRSTGARSPRPCGRSTPPPPSRPPKRTSRPSPPTGNTPTPRSSDPGASPGTSSLRSWSSPPSCDEPSTPPTRSRASTPGSAERSAIEATHRNEQAAMKILYLVATTKRKNRENLAGKTNGSKTILNTLTVHYGDRIADHIR